MRVPIPWLREYCDPDLDLAGIEERLTMTGTKVEASDRQGVPSTEHFVVGRVIDVAPHPDADRLKVCTVDLGDAARDAASIVCGAPNVASGQTVAVARPGALLPDGRQLGEARLRGVLSEGMILAAGELGLGPDGGGILVLDEQMLDAELAPGTPLAEVLPIASDVLELEITPNRPDCLGVYGVARELHAASGAPLSEPPWSEDPGSPGALAAAQVRVECPDLCPRFTARVFERVTIAPSPLWLRARLIAAGQRPINNVVDITNYVMLATAQPLHAFDLDRVGGARLTVRRARDGEQLRTLDGQTRTLDDQMVLIEDAQGPTSIAGVMGGERSEVSEQTTRVLMEVANWDGPNIHRTSVTLGLRSEASSRFEKGLQPEQCMQAQALAARLMLQLCGAELLGGTIDVGTPPPAPRRLGLRETRVRAILGVPVPRARQQQILRALDFAAEESSDGLAVTVPPLRRDDVTREIDLVEEVARIDGVERLPATLPARRGAAGMLTGAQRLRRVAEDALAGSGLHEIQGWSFADPGLLERLRVPDGHELRRVVQIENPLSAEQAIMRPTLLGSMLEAARHNVTHNGPDVSIFESGTVYRAAPAGAQGDARANPQASAETGVEEHHALGALLTGSLAPRSWRGKPAQADFFSAKALLEALLERLHVRWSLAPAAWPPLHPGRSAAVLVGDQRLGVLGELHPLVAAGWELARTAVFELDLDGLLALAPAVASFRPFASVPPLREDIAVVAPAALAASELLARVRQAGGELLAHAEIFDAYTGEQLPPGKRSLGVALTFRAAQRTLSDEEVAPLRAQIVAALAELGAELRG